MITALPTDMAAIAIARPGGPDVLEPVRLPLPALRAGEVLIAVAAAGVNGPDLSQRRGAYPPPADASPLPGLEVAGRIAAVGEGVAGLAPGDPVVALCNGGGYAEYVAVPAGQVLPLPAGWSMREGATLPETFFTLAQTLLMRAGLEPAMTVLVEGAAGGIGGSAIQIATALGATAIGLVSSEEKAAYVAGLGAAHVVLRGDDLAARIRALTDGRGLDRIVAMSGGETLAALVEAAARSAHIVLLAALSGKPAPIEAGRIVQQQLILSGSTLRPQTAATKAAIARHLNDRIWPLIAAGRIRPPRIIAFPLARAADAHRALEDRAHYGKCVLETGR